MLVHDLGLSHRACDRCHGQKLRCKREGNDASCLRCQKAGVHCVPRLVRTQRRTRSNASQGMPASGPEQKETDENFAAEQGNQESAQPFNPSPLPLPDMTSDLDLGLDFSPLENDLTHLHEDTFDAQVDARFGNLDPPFNQATGNLSPAEFDMLPYFPEATASAAQSCVRRASRESTLRGPKPLSRGDPNVDIADPNPEDRRTNRTPDRQERFQQLDGRPASASRPRSKRADMGSLEMSIPQTTMLSVEHLTSWIRRLSELSIELHHHMLSIPLTKAERSGRKEQGTSRDPQNTKAMHQGQQVHVDRTLELSQQYTKVLVEAIPSSKSHQGRGVHAPALRLDLASQLLVLSGFMCLVDSYDRILRHIREWIQSRSKTGSCIPEGYCLMPELAIGAHRLPESSSARPLVLVCLIETAVMQTHGAVSHLLKSPIGYASPRRGSIITPTECDAGGETGGVAMISLQAITAREEATLELIQDVWKLATDS
ncbi:hypothetical protein M3J09_006095 [Ascochyta lentis]